jgi:hypothetical protein
MRNIRLLIVILLLAGTALPAFAAGHRPSKNAKAKTPENHETIIASATPTELKVTEDKETKTFVLTQFTEITLDGKRVTSAELKPGLKVSVTLGSDPTHLSRVAATSK